jgi:hypothetical protein
LLQVYQNGEPGQFGDQGLVERERERAAPKYMAASLKLL